MPERWYDGVIPGEGVTDAFDSAWDVADWQRSGGKCFADCEVSLWCSDITVAVKFSNVGGKLTSLFTMWG